MSKKKLLTVAIVVLILTLLANSTYAYYTVIGKTTNVVTSGDISMTIVETTDKGLPFPREGVAVIPGDIVGKNVSVLNTGGHPFWLRVKLIYGVDGEVLSPEDAPLVLNLNTTSWVRHGDYFYYKSALRPRQTTVPLFTQVEINGAAVDQHDFDSLMTLTVKAYAVQSENNPAGNPWDASGWPAD